MTDRASAPPTREAILECLRTADVPLTPAELAERLGAGEAQAEALERRLAAMERDGQLLPNRKGVMLLASKLDFVAGRVQGHRDGFGFVIPDDGSPDLFLSPRQMQKVMHGDRVLVRRIGVDNRGRAEGAVVEVTERGNRRLVGRFLDERGAQIVVPEDQRIKHDILIPPGDAGGARHGQVVGCEIVDPPSSHAPPIGRVVEVLGEIDDPGMEIEIAVRKFDVPHEFPPEALALADAMPDLVRLADMKGRVDLRDVDFVTIDGVDARDFDDAVYCEPIETGRGKARRANGFRLLVAIADVGHYVEAGEAIDAEAALRGTSVYFPRRVIPMLPEKLSNGLCSLNPEVDRLALVCDAVLDADGAVRAYQFYEAAIRSQARLTYDGVWAALSGREPFGSQELGTRLTELHDLYRVLAKARAARGAMDFDTVETRIVCDEVGRIERIEPAARNDAHRLIEECMLVANVCAADFLGRSRHPGLYRVHEGPTVEKLRALREFLRTVGLELGGGDDPRPADYATLAAAIKGRPDERLLQAMMLRSMQQAVYSPENVGHFGLAYEAYTHFTSPIRRYPDLLVHRVIKQLIRGRRLHLGEELARTHAPLSDAASAHEVEHWHALGVRSSATERRADDASRDVQAWLKCQFMRDRVGEQFLGRVTGVAPFGVFVTLDSLFVEGLVHVSELGGEYFQYVESAHELRGERTGRRYRLTDEIEIQVARVDLEARRMEFRPVARGGYRELVRGAAPDVPALSARLRKKAAPAKSDEVKAAREARRRKPELPAAARAAKAGKGGKAGARKSRTGGRGR